MKFTKYKDFFEYINPIEVKDIEHFKKIFMKADSKGGFENPVNVLDTLKELPEDDFRNKKVFTLMGDRESRDIIIEAYYKFFITNRDILLRKWFDGHLKVKDPGSYISMKLDYNIKKGDILRASHNSKYGRILKNLHYKNIYDIKKTNAGVTRPTVKQGLFDLYRTWVADRCIVIPTCVKKVREQNYEDFFAIVRGTYQSASILNPYFFAWCLRNIFKTKKLLTPTLSWSSPVIASINAKVEEHIGVDVIPDVCEKSEGLYDYFNSDIKNKMYCCPSEKLDERHDFSNKYKEHFDTIFFCPPYFTCEMYQGGEQAHENYSEYETWLKEYWRKTVETSYNVCKKDGYFSYIISDFKDDSVGKMIPISKDTSDIASEYFELEKVYKVSWNTQKSLHVKKFEEGNYENMYVFRKK